MVVATNVLPLASRIAWQRFGFKGLLPHLGTASVDFECGLTMAQQGIAAGQTLRRPSRADVAGAIPPDLFPATIKLNDGAAAVVVDQIIAVGQNLGTPRATKLSFELEYLLPACVNDLHPPLAVGDNNRVANFNST